MSIDRDVARLVRAWLQRDARENADRVLELVLDQLDATPQHRATWPMRRFAQMNSTIRLVAAAAVVVVVALIGYQFLIAPNVGGPGPSPPASPSAEPPPSESPGPVNFTELQGGGTALEPGTYVIDVVSPVLLTFTVPDEPLATWPSHWSKALYDWGPWHQTNTGRLGVANVTNLFRDPCDRQGGLMAAIGPSISDLVAALGDVPGLQLSDPTDVTLSGYSGQYVELTGERAPGCRGPEPLLWDTTTTEPTLLMPDVGDYHRVWILDVEGDRIVIWASEDNGFTYQEQLQALVESLVITVE